nr:MAG TPA: hypothetical protein [Caudoviricetes sp.]
MRIVENRKRVLVKHPGGGRTGPVTTAHLAPQPSAKSKSHLYKTDKHSKDNPIHKIFLKTKRVNPVQIEMYTRQAESLIGFCTVNK